MKKIFIFILLLLSTICLYSQNSAYNKKIHKDYGTWSVKNGSNLISISAFLTIELDENVIHENEAEVDGLFENDKKYHYELYFVSKSTFDDDITNTWLYGVEIYINGENIYENQFPDGFIVSIKTDPTLIHTHHDYDDDVKFKITWEKAIYEPRIRK